LLDAEKLDMILFSVSFEESLAGTLCHEDA